MKKLLQFMESHRFLVGLTSALLTLAVLVMWSYDDKVNFSNGDILAVASVLVGMLAFALLVFLIAGTPFLQEDTYRPFDHERD